MNKKFKILFLSFSLILLLTAVSAVSATDDTNTTGSIVSCNNDNSISESVENNNQIIKTEKKLKDEKTGNVKTSSENINKNIKKTTQTNRDVTDYNTLKTAWNDIQANGDNTTNYIINLKNGKYNFDEQLENQKGVLNITLNGENKDKVIFNGQNKTRFFNLTVTNQHVNFNNITFTNGFNESGIGAINANSITTFNNTKFINNKVFSQTDDVYTGVLAIGRNTTITNSEFINNSAHTIEGFMASGGVISFSGHSTMFTFKIDSCSFINNSVSSSYKSLENGGAIDYSSDSLLNITNTRFVNNSANMGGAIYIGYIYPRKEPIIQLCAFENNTATTGSEIYFADRQKGSNINSNYYSNPGNKGNIIVLVNNQEPGSIITQKTQEITIKCVSDSNNVYKPISNIGNNYSFTLTSSSNLINTTNIKLSPENNYTAKINISNLPDNFENITINMGIEEVAKIAYDYTKIELNNTHVNAGNTIELKATFRDKNGILLPKGRVVFKLNDKTIGHSNIKFGTAKLNYTIPSTFSPKDYKLSVKYGGSYDFMPAKEDAILTVNRINTKIDLKTEIKGNTLKINVNPTDKNNKTITSGKICVKINGKTLQTLNITGKTIINYTIPKSWNNREIKVLAIYGENSKYNTNRTEITMKIVLLGNKNTKTEEVKKETIINNYYVSANSGSDTNSGTQSSPFKTIQKAITTVNTNKQPANIYLDGEFKGVGNTNLTIPGNLHINFIGIGNSSINGEVKYDLKEKLLDGEYFWDSSVVWRPYENGTGNWAMNITGGNGLIKITNLTVKNCWSDGESNFNSYKTGAVTNYGNLEVENVSFIYNHGGVGAAVLNRESATIKITNSLFEANRKSSSTGNYGAGVYNNGTATIINCTFQKNYARWGTVTNDKNMTITNSTICDNIGYDGGSTFKTGSAITINTQSTDFFTNSTVGNVVTIIDGCTFINNDQLDIYADTGNLNLTNNIFNQSTGVFSPAKTNNNVIFNIKNNTFDLPVGSSLYTSLSSKDKIVLTLRLYGEYLYNIDSNKIMNVTGSTSKALELTASNSNITNNNFSRMIYISGSENKITNNTITTVNDLYTINLTITSLNNIVSENYLQTSTLSGDTSVLYTSLTNKLVNNKPDVKILQINDESFFRYFDDDGNLLPAYMNIEQIQFIGSLNNLNLNLGNNIISVFQTTTSLVSNNITITSTGILNVTGLIVENTNQQPIINISGNNGVIQKTNLKTNGNYTIVVSGNNNTIENNTLLADILVGDNSVNVMGTENKVNSNTPTYINYIISDNTYNTYFNDDGTLKDINQDIHFIVNGTIKNKDLILNNNKTITITNYVNAKLLNCTIKTLDETKLVLTNITINNTNGKLALDLNTLNVTIMYNNITATDMAVKINNTQYITLSYNNISVYSMKDAVALNIENSSLYASSRINYNNITSIGVEKSYGIYVVNMTRAIFNYNNFITNTTLTYDNDEACSVKIIDSPVTSKYQKTEIYSSIFNINAKSNVTLGDIDNATIDISVSDVTIRGSNVNVIKLNNVVSSIINRNSIQLMDKNARFIVVNNSQSTEIGGNIINGNSSNNINVIIIDNSNNISVINSNEITLDGVDNKAVVINNSENIKIQSNIIESLSDKNDDISPVLLTNSILCNLENNTITTTNKYAITIDESASKNAIVGNNLYANEYIANRAILNLNSDNNKVSGNNPRDLKTYFYLNDKTYNEFFNDDGTLNEELPDGVLLQLTGNLHDKLININKPINIDSNNTYYKNVTIIILPEARGTNLTNVKLIGDNNKIIINADNCNVEILNLTLSNIKNTSAIDVNGNNNDIIIEDIYLRSDSESDIIGIKITGNNNRVTQPSTTYPYLTIRNYKKAIGVLCNNSNNNTINLNFTNVYGNSISLYLNNSNNNKINIPAPSVSDNTQLMVLKNSSNNIITGKQLSSASSMVNRYITLEDNSNNNTLYQFNIRLSSTEFINAPISIINSNYNHVYNNTINLTSYYGYIVNITEGVDNKVEYNIFQTRNLDGNDCIIQENKNETINNIIRYNSVTEGYQSQINLTLPTTIKMQDTITIKAVVQNRNGTSWNAKYIPTLNGEVTFKINGKEIATVSVVNGEAIINYKITGKDKNQLYIEAMYADPTMNIGVVNTTVTAEIEKLATTILLPNITNDGTLANMISMVIDENGNIIYDGNITYKINNQTIQTIKITNGIAQITINTENYQLKDSQITAEFSGNSECKNITTTSTLTINKYNVQISTNPITTNNGNNINITTQIKDMNGNNINNGYVIFKLNGKTLKDKNGKTIQAQIRNGIATLTYYVNNMGIKNYTLTAVAIGDEFNREETNTTLTVTKTTPTITIQNILKRTNNITPIIIKVTDNQNDPVNTTISIKLNGKTVQKIKAENTTVVYNMDLTRYKNSQYDLTVVSGQDKNYNRAETTTVLKIE